MPLTSPSQLYDRLLAGVTTAQRRISLASLYLGTGAMEQELMHALVSSINAARARGDGGLDVAVQLDYHRARRSAAGNVKPGVAPTLSAHGAPAPYDSSVSLLAAAQRRCTVPTDLAVGLTCMPQLRTWLARRVPPRWIEGGGVFHIKAYAFDDDVIMSGANLSHDYFTHRQDRAVWLRHCPDLAHYIHTLTRQLQRLPGSHTLQPDGSLTQNGVRGGESQREVDERFTSSFRSTLRQASWVQEGHATAPTPPPAGMVVVRPRLQCSSVGVDGEEAALVATLQGLRPSPHAITAPTSASPPSRALGDTLHLATGYFNMPAQYQRPMLHHPSPITISILTAAPTANGFYNGRSLSGGIPMAYSEILRKFYRRIVAAGRVPMAGAREGAGTTSHHVDDVDRWFRLAPGISLHEYQRRGWTFHGKGLWRVTWAHVVEGGAVAAWRPVQVCTWVGSSNFGVRSVTRDVELHLQLDTADPDLMHRLMAECATHFGARVQPHGLQGQPSRGGGSSGDDAGGGDAHVLEVGDHVVGEGDVWARQDRQLHGWSWSNGLWIAVVGRALARFF